MPAGLRNPPFAQALTQRFNWLKNGLSEAEDRLYPRL